jgi:hypothetical protein
MACTEVNQKGQKMAAKSVWRLAASAMSIATLGGCASIAKGVTQALLGQKREDQRKCQIKGLPTKGLRALLEEQDLVESSDAFSRRTLKVLMVHGIGHHIPGYSARHQEHLVSALDLKVTEQLVKEIELKSPLVDNNRTMGGLRIHRYLNKERNRELLFHELTWSGITDPEKKKLDYDNSNE